jgi:hypothetical protein
MTVRNLYVHVAFDLTAVTNELIGARHGDRWLSYERIPCEILLDTSSVTNMAAVPIIEVISVKLHEVGICITAN